MLLGGLRAAVPVPVAVPVHLGPVASRLDMVLGRVSPMPVEWVVDGARPAPGRVTCVPGDGTTFTVWVPFTQPGGGPTTAPAGSGGDVPTEAAVRNRRAARELIARIEARLALARLRSSGTP